MPAFSLTSRGRLDSCHPDLIRVMERVIEVIDFSVLYGHRSVEVQQNLYAQGRTVPGQIVTNIDGVRKLSKHNHSPSLAVDVAPYPIDWEDHDRFLVLGGFVMATARELGIGLRWGNDWDSDWNYKEHSFRDLPHFELSNAPTMAGPRPLITEVK